MEIGAHATWGLAELADPTAVVEVRQKLHDYLIETTPIRLSPVQWFEFSTAKPEEAIDVVRELGAAAIDEKGLELIRRHAGDLVLIVAIVDCPFAPETPA